MPYREIHRLTGVSVTTIGRVARYLAAGNGGYALAGPPPGGALTMDTDNQRLRSPCRSPAG